MANAQQKTKPYLIDDEPADANDIFKAALHYGYHGDFHTGIKFTSQAAMTLRQNGHKVENNPNYKE